MRSAFVAVLLAITLFGSVGQERPSSKPDGRMWQTFSNLGPQSLNVKAAYVQGAIEGFRVGAAEGYYAGRNDEKNDALAYIKPCLEKGPCAGVPLARMIKPETESSWKEISAGADKVVGRLKLQNISVLDIVHQTDKFYSDYRNTPICMIVAVQESIFSLNGKASSEQELALERTGCNP